MANSRTIGVVVCGVLEWNLRRIESRLTGTRLAVRVLPAKLHANPAKLRGILQEEIEALTNAEPDLEAIVLGFGVCGRGTIGVKAGSVPLVMARAQDCIGICLGSHRRYASEFARRPGTRYMFRGWYDATMHERRHGNEYYTERAKSLYETGLNELTERYGEENARFICEFRNSWHRNYQRSAYIAFPGEDDRTARQAGHALAESLGWEQEDLEGDESMLEAMLAGEWDDPRILVVPPGAKTVTAPGTAVVGYVTGAQLELEELVAAFNRRGGEGGAPSRQGIGLGIDTGGTFTDAVLYDFTARNIRAWAKAPTVHRDLVQGIRDALRELPDDVLSQSRCVGISTTLATNAFVEGKGRPVALLIMGSPCFDPADYPFRYVHELKGRIDMEGNETEPVDEAQVRHLAREAQAAGCEAFAVSGFAGVVNPAHEIRVARLACEETGLHAVCGHELTTKLNFRERAVTAAMNARLVPLIEALLEAIRAALGEFGLGDRRVMVVKGDGSQLLDKVACEIPVETLLSGPAASVVGGAELAGRPDAVVADMGGTTLDVAMLRNSLPVRSESGARIGRFQTSVRAMAVRTSGLGGDSEIDLSGWPEVRIGPRRIIPVCRLVQACPALRDGLDILAERAVTPERHCLEFLTVEGDADGSPILDRVRDRPKLLIEVARELDLPSPRFLDWRHLEDTGRALRGGLTLTDVLHVEGRYAAHDREASRALLAAWAVLLEESPKALLAAIHREFRRLVCGELAAAASPNGHPWDDDPRLREWLTEQFSAGQQNPTPFRLRFGMPIVGVGAPVETLFPQLDEVCGTEVIVSEYSGVANALGAVAGHVALSEEAVVRITEEGAMLCSWRGGSTRCIDMPSALETCARALNERIRREAEDNEIPYSEPVMTATIRQGQLRGGSVLFGVDVLAELRG